MNLPKHDDEFQEIGGYLFHVKDVVYINSQNNGVVIAFRSGQQIQPIIKDGEEEKLKLAFLKYHEGK